MMLQAATQTYWQGTVDEPIRFPPLEQDLWVDVAVLGAGITGLTAALLLKQAGKKVAVLEGGRVGSGTTGATSAHLTAVTDLPLDQLMDRFGQGGAALAIEAQNAGMDRIRRWAEGFSIDCELREQAGYRYCEQEGDVPRLERECDAALRLGLPATMTRQVPLPFPCAAALRVEDQARFHPLNYLHALAGVVHGGGCALFERTRAEPPQDGEPCRVRTPGGTVTAEKVIVAAHGPLLGAATLATRVFPYQSYLLAARLEGDAGGDGAAPDGLFWDTAEPYHYLRRASDAEPDLFLIGGADHKTGQGGDERGHFEELEAYARQRFAIRAVEQRWSAGFYEPADGLPYIGAVPRTAHLLQACGYSGTGLTFGTAAGMLMADLALGRDNPWAELFDPRRVRPLASLPRIASENLNVAGQYLSRRLGPRARGAPEEAADAPEAVPPGSGRIVGGGGGEPVAVYRAADGRVYAMSSVCTHMGCRVSWNEAQRTWDCPCHGGRYTPTGKVFAGPPPADLARAPRPGSRRRRAAAGTPRRPRRRGSP